MIPIKIGIALFSTRVMTNLLSLLAKLVKHQIDSNCNFGEEKSYANSNSRGTKPRSTVAWMGGPYSKERSRRSPRAANILCTFLSALIISTKRGKSDILNWSEFTRFMN